MYVGVPERLGVLSLSQDGQVFVRGRRGQIPT